MKSDNTSAPVDFDFLKTLSVLYVADDDEIPGKRGKLYDQNVVDSCIRVPERSSFKFWD